jgi:hypothetical protein
MTATLRDRYGEILGMETPGTVCELLPPHALVTTAAEVVSFPVPADVGGLRMFASAVQYKYLKQEGGKVIGTAYVFMADNGSPLGIVDEPSAVLIHEQVQQVAEAIKELPGHLPVDHPTWNDHNVYEIIRDAQAYRDIRAKYGGIETRLKPGPDPRTMEEIIEIVEKWRGWKRSGYTQQAFCDFELNGSRKVLSSCLRRYRDEFGPDSI